MYELNFITAYSKPFRMTFKTDEEEIAVGTTELLNEHSSADTTTPSGILGFNLAWTLQAC